jgi:hypothetical protein
MKYLMSLFICVVVLLTTSCNPRPAANVTAQQEQTGVEENQRRLNQVQPPPRVTWSLERDNLIKRFKLMNDRSVLMYMYVFNYGSNAPIGYYQVNKVSSVNSQLTNPNQIVAANPGSIGQEYRYYQTLPSPAEDGSYGTNGDAIFGFTPDNIYIEHNMQYICATAPLNFNTQPPNLGAVSVESLEKLRLLMERLDGE